MTMTPAATVLFRAEPRLLNTLLAALCHQGRRVYIYANGPTSPEVDEILAAHDGLELLRSGENAGHAVGLNTILNRAHQDKVTHIVLFDQDSTPDVTFVEKLRNAFDAAASQTPPVAAVGPLLVPPAGEDYLPIRYEWRDKRHATSGQFGLRDVQFLPTSGTLISVAAWRDVGCFREDYFIGGVDVEWGLRAWARGYASAVATDVRMEHRWGEQGRGISSARHQFFRQPADRIYLYVRNTVHKLTLPHIPFSWKASHGARLAAQLALATCARRRPGFSSSLYWRALKDGWHGRLGPAPGDLLADAVADPAAGRPQSNLVLTTGGRAAEERFQFGRHDKGLTLRRWPDGVRVPSKPSPVPRRRVPEQAQTVMTRQL